MTTTTVNHTDEWLKQLEGYIEMYNHKRKFPMRHNALVRSVNWCALPVICAPCCIWSTMWRIMCCPFMCLVKGPSFVCSDNGCTFLTDACMARYIEDTISLNRMSPLPQAWTTSQEERLEKLLHQIDLIYNNIGTYDKAHYKLADACFDTTPAMIPVITREIRAKVKNRRISQ